MIDPTLLQLQLALEDAGFTFDAKGGRVWWCWCGPLDDWDVEVGDDQKTTEAAVFDALRHMSGYMRDAQRALDETETVA